MSIIAMPTIIEAHTYMVIEQECADLRQCVKDNFFFFVTKNLESGVNVQSKTVKTLRLKSSYKDDYIYFPPKTLAGLKRGNSQNSRFVFILKFKSQPLDIFLPHVLHPAPK
jgi:hypothetical protein